MDDEALTNLQKRINRLERTTVRFRAGVVTATSPLTVTLGGSSVAYVDVAKVGTVTVGAHVAVLVWGNDLLVLGTIS